MCSRRFGEATSDWSGLSCNKPSFPWWAWLCEVSSKIRAAILSVLVRLARSLTSFAGERDTVLCLVGTRNAVDSAVVALKGFEERRRPGGRHYVRFSRIFSGFLVVKGGGLCMFGDVLGSSMINQCDNVRVQVLAETFESS